MRILTFRRNSWLPSSGSNDKPSKKPKEAEFGLLFNPEDVGDYYET
jgi:hypothetical protein